MFLKYIKKHLLSTLKKIKINSILPRGGKRIDPLQKHIRSIFLNQRVECKMLFFNSKLNLARKSGLFLFHCIL